MKTYLELAKHLRSKINPDYATHLGTESYERRLCAEAIEGSQAEIKRLAEAIKWEQSHAERIGTHGPGCHAWGPAHWECAMREIERLTEAMSVRPK